MVRCLRDLKKIVSIFKFSCIKIETVENKKKINYSFYFLFCCNIVGVEEMELVESIWEQESIGNWEHFVDKKGKYVGVCRKSEGKGVFRS